jgi:hypothetical protein
MSQETTYEIVAELKDLLARERITLVPILEGIAKIEERELYLELGYDSMWAFLKRELGQSEAMIHYRLASSRMLRRFPQVTEPLRDGRLCMTVLASLARVLTEENVDALIAEAMGKPTSEVKRIVRGLDPKPVPKDVTTESPRSSEVIALPIAAEPIPMAAEQPVRTEILTASLARKHITIDREYEELFTRVRAILSHKMPGAAELDIIKEGFRAIIKQDEKRKGIVDKPRADTIGKNGKISRSVKRIVQERDRGKCQWRSEDGGICGSTYRVEFHHKQDRAKGGLGTPDNIIQLCEKHHLLATEIAWGEQHIAKYRKQPSAPEDLQSQLDFNASQ